MSAEEHQLAKGHHILVVEDEAMIAMLIEDMLRDLGSTPIGPAYTAEQALELISAERIDAAILDINLDGQRTDFVAATLLSKNIPFLFASGYASAGIDKLFSGQLVLTKPFKQSELERALKRLLPSPEGTS